MARMRMEISNNYPQELLFSFCSRTSGWNYKENIGFSAINDVISVGKSHETAPPLFYLWRAGLDFGDHPSCR